MPGTLRKLTHALILFAACAAAASAQVPATPASAADRFAPYAFLAGGTWTVVDDVPGAAANAVTEYTFEWVLGGKFLQSRHTATREGKTLSSSISFIGWDAARQSMAQWGFNNAGLTAVLYAAPGSVPDSFTLEGKLGSSERAPQIRSTYRRIAENELEVRTEMLRDGKFETVGTVRLKRSSPANPQPRGEGR